MVIRYGFKDECHKVDFCFKCDGKNKLSNELTDCYGLMECNTECSVCGHKSFWAYGVFFEEDKRK